MRQTRLLRPVQLTLGFTLIEVLLAMSALALLSAMSWQSIDALIQAQARNEANAQKTHLLHSTLQQFEVDLNALVETQVVSGIDFDGKRLRLTRSDPLQRGLGVRVVAWSVEKREGQDTLVRWQSALLGTRGEVESAWRVAANSSSAKAGEIRTLAVSGWQIYYFRRNAWVNPLSANEQAQAQALAVRAAQVAEAARRSGAGIAPGGTTGSPPANDPLAVNNTNLALIPDAVRLQITPLGVSSSNGPVTKDWIRPQWTPSQN